MSGLCVVPAAVENRFQALLMRQTMRLQAVLASVLLAASPEIFNFFCRAARASSPLGRVIERRKGVRKTIATHVKTCESHSRDTKLCV